MDSLKSLMDKRQYDLVIKLTEDSQDMNYLFYRISALLATGRGEEALSVIKKNREILQGDLTLLMKVHIEILCLLNNFDEAYEEVKYYENLPYVSQEVEEIIRDLPKLVREEEKKSLSSRELSNDALKERLKSNDETVVLPALDMVRGRDINMFLPDIQRIMLSFPKQSIRSFALLLLVQKKIDKELSFNHIGKAIKINPSQLEPPFIGNEFNDFVRALQNELKDPVVSEDAVQILSSYIIYMYPEKLDIKYDLLIEALRNISEEYLQIENKTPLSARCALKGIDEKEVLDLIQRIKEAINSF
ncbi:MAG: hypothetical protein J5511_00480 [Bacilli bacterium]|nr:hypothetical protein [Bacilli bacterium]